jgi:putative membrane protein
MRSHKRKLARAALVGTVAGLAGAWTMSRFAGLWGKFALKQNPHPVQAMPGKLVMNASPQEWDSTLMVAERIGENLLSHGLTRKQRALAATAVHYAMGASVGAVYGMASEMMPRLRAGSGVVFGIALWATGVEILLPTIGVTRKLNDYSLSMQAHSAGEHMVYGLTTELVRSAVRNRL